MNPWIEDIESYIPGQTIEGCIKLASNENSYGPSPRVLKAIAQASSSLNRYPYKDDAVREKTAQYCNVKRDNIILGNGSDELIDLVVKTFKGAILSVYPTFATYRISSQISNREYIEVRLNPDLSFPLEEFISNSRKADILFVCSPNNPTGMVLPEKGLREILDEGKITVIDEAYFEFYGKTAVKLLDDYDNLIVLRTFAKAFALAGLRMGYIVANPTITGLLYKVKPPFNVNSLAQEAALAALDDTQYMKSTVNKIVEDREFIYNKISEMFKAFKSHANFILVDTTPLSSDEFYGRLLEKKIIVRNLKRFTGFRGEYCRISIGTTGENRKLIKAVSELC